MHCVNGSIVLTSLLFLIPAAEQIKSAGEKPGFNAAQKESSNQKMSSVLACRHCCYTCSPEEPAVSEFVIFIKELLKPTKLP